MYFNCFVCLPVIETKVVIRLEDDIANLRDEEGTKLRLAAVLSTSFCQYHAVNQFLVLALDERGQVVHSTAHDINHEALCGNSTECIDANLEVIIFIPTHVKERERVHISLISPETGYVFDTIRPIVARKNANALTTSPYEGKVIYLHVPKTGGYSISRSLRDAYALSLEAPHFYSHFRISELHSYGVDLTKHLILITVRNPYDRVRSYYEYRLYKNQSLSEYAISLLSNGDKDIEPITNYTTYHNGNFLVTQRMMIIRFESLENDFGIFCKQLGLTCFWKHLNLNIKRQTSKYEVLPHFTPEAREVIEKYYYNDFRLFNYSYYSFVEDWLKRQRQMGS